MERSRRGWCSAGTRSTATSRTPTPGWVAPRGPRRWPRRAAWACSSKPRRSGMASTGHARGWLDQAKTAARRAPILTASTSKERTDVDRRPEPTRERRRRAAEAGTAEYLLAGQASELERLHLQSLVWEPSGRRLLEEIGDGRGAGALDVGCGVLGWLRVLSEWVGPDGEVTGSDIDEAMLGAADRFVTEEGLRNVGLVKDDLFASELEPDSFDLVHARYEICPLGRGHEQMETYLRLARPGGTDRARGPGSRLLALQSAGPRPGAADRADRGGVPAERRRLGRGATPPPAPARVRHRGKRPGRGRWRWRRRIRTCACRCSSPPPWRSGCCRW